MDILNQEDTPKPTIQTYDIDPLVVLVRAQCRIKTVDDVYFLQHVAICKLAKDVCKVKNCESGRNHLAHYKQCNDGKCLHCANARLIELIDKVNYQSVLKAPFYTSKYDLANIVTSIKTELEKYKQVKTELIPDLVKLEYYKNKLQKLNKEYIVLKDLYIEKCVVVYDEWKMLKPHYIGPIKVHSIAPLGRFVLGGNGNNSLIGEIDGYIIEILLAEDLVEMNTAFESESAYFTKSAVFNPLEKISRDLKKSKQNPTLNTCTIVDCVSSKFAPIDAKYVICAAQELMLNTLDKLGDGGKKNITLYDVKKLLNTDCALSKIATKDQKYF
jgi:hypothetical protein